MLGVESYPVSGCSALLPSPPPPRGHSTGIGQAPHLLRRNWASILLLAFPGTLINFGLIGVCAKYFFPYGWTWSESLLFGVRATATCSAHTPGAPVLPRCALLNALRAPGLLLTWRAAPLLTRGVRLPVPCRLC